PYAERLASEAKRERAAREAGTPYVPLGHVRAVPRADGKGHVLVEEPQTDAEALDDRMVASAAQLVEADGRVRLTLAVRDDRLEVWRTFVARNAGLKMAVVLDGALLGTTPIPATPGHDINLALWPVPAPDASM